MDEPEAGCAYRHTKSGKVYVVIVVAREEAASTSRKVVYRRADGTGQTWCRSLSSWNSLEPNGERKFVRA